MGRKKKKVCKILTDWSAKVKERIQYFHGESLLQVESSDICEST